NDLLVRSNRPGDLIQEALDSALIFIPELERSCLSTAEVYRGSDLALAQRGFNETLEGCQWLFDTLMHLRGAASGVGAPIAHPERWFEAEKMIARVVKDVSEAYVAADYVLVADLLEYELTGSIAVWREVLDHEKARRTP